MSGNPDLEALLERARRDPSEATRALEAFANALGGAAHAQVAALAIGPKLWFTFNGVAIDWRTRDSGSRLRSVLGSASGAERLVLLALVGSGLRRSELLRLRLGDVGALDADGRLVPNLAADPLAVRYVQVRGQREFVTFLSDQARDALLADVARRTNAGERIDLQAPLVATVHGTAATKSSVARASRFNTALIEAGNNVNVDLCVATGRFFRAWGLPGARFAAAHASSEEVS